MKEILIKEYNNIETLRISPKKPQDYTFNVNFIQGAFLEIRGNKEGKFLVEFQDLKTGHVIHKTILETNMWTRTNRKYYTTYKIKVTDLKTNQSIFQHTYLAKGKRVYISLESKSIGDTLAWLPYLEEFRKAHECELIISTFHNNLFQCSYPDIKFVNPGEVVYNLYAMYQVGWFYNEEGEVDGNMNPLDFKQNPLGKTCSDVLGLPYKEIKPKLDFSPKLHKPNFTSKYVCISPHASALAKYWNFPGGWQTIVNYLNKQGYKVVLISLEKLGDKWHDSKIGGKLTGVIDKTGDLPLEDRMIDLYYADFYIGVGSGLAWLNWALNKPTILISGFSEPYSEFEDCERIYPLDPKVCKGCFNNHRLDAGDWRWCPINKNTEKEFECTKTITPNQVVKSIDRIVKNE